MVYIPDIVDYKPFFIQKEGDEVARNTTDWGLVAKSNPYPLLPTPKEPYKNEWHDENGDDEWCEEMHYQSIDMSVSFYAKAYDSETESSEQVIRNQIEDFFSHIASGTFKIYDSYTGIGRGNVRYAGFEEEEFVSREKWSRAIFSVRFKINDPVTRYIISNGKIEKK